MNLGKVYGSLGLLIGMIVGAGMFALPYAVSRSGVFWGGIHMLAAFFIVVLLHIYYGEVTYVIKERHRLPGYARKLLGPYAGHIATFSLIFGFYGSLLAYGILAGTFLSELVNAPEHHMTLSILFFVLTSPLLLFDMRKVGSINFWLTLPLIFFVLLVGAFAFPHVKASNFIFVDNANWFFPYGIFLFSFGGAAAIPEISEIFKKHSGHLFNRVILFGALIPAVIYLVFIVSVVGVSGTSTTQEAIAGMANVLGGPIVQLGAVIGFFAVLTSYLALGIDLRAAYHYDYGFGRLRAWFMVAVIPLILYILGVNNFISIIGVVGTIMVGINGVIILLLANYIRVHYSHPHGFIHINKVMTVFLMALFILGVVLQLIEVF